MCRIRLTLVCRSGDRITERMSDYITGHAHRTIGAKYGAPTVEHMAAALEKFPRYEIA
jgi:hypothetical protein